MQTSTEITEPYEAQTTPLSSVANKKRVHYPHANGEQASKATLDDIEQGKTAASKIINLMFLFFFIFDVLLQRKSQPVIM